jgi:hypothetical protein
MKSKEQDDSNIHLPEPLSIPFVLLVSPAVNSFILALHWYCRNPRRGGNADGHQSEHEKRGISPL